MKAAPRIVAAAVGAALVALTIVRFAKSDEPIVITNKLGAADPSPPTTYLRQNPTRIGTATTVIAGDPAPYISSTPSGTIALYPSNGTASDALAPHTPLPWDYALVIPDLSPMITIAAEMAPAAPDDVMQAIKAGWPPELRDTALAVAQCESGLNSIAVHPNPDLSIDYGLFQINDTINGKGSTLAGLGGTPQLALDVNWNAAASYRLFLSRGWEPWRCATSLHLLLDQPTPGRYPLPPFPDATTTTPATQPPDTEPVNGQPGN